MLQKITELQHSFDDTLKSTKTVADLEALKVRFLGKKGPIQDLMKFLRDVPDQERPTMGKYINDLKEYVTNAITTALTELVQKEENDRLKSEKIDVTLPGYKKYPGRKHPITHALDEIIEILVSMGFSVQYGPDIDTEYYNFEALNFAPDHPAKDMQDTFYLAPNVLLRTHTSNIQARVMESNKPPIRIIAPGKAYRNETVTARSHVVFHQVELLYIDVDVSFASLQSTMKTFLSRLFKTDIEMRFRPSYFPFVEPGMEVDIGCLACQGTGCPLCKQTGWLEIAGAGMVHPEVLKNGGIDPEVYTGFAWGMGIERLLLLKKGINDIRLFSDNDMRFLSQFSAL